MKKYDVLRLGVVGLGPRGNGLFELAGKRPDVRPAAFCEIDPVRRDEGARRFPGAKPFASFDGLLASGLIDALLVETPADRHADFCARALRAGIHTLSDVPCVFSREEADLLWAAEQSSSALFMFGANPNFWGFVDAAADARGKGLLGDPVFLEAEYIHDCRPLFAQSPWRATLPPILYCTHSLGPLLRLLEEDLRWVSCFDSGGHIESGEDRHDVMTALFRTASNVLVRVTCSFINEFKGGLHGYRVMGTRGCFERTAGRGTVEPPRTLCNSLELEGMRNITQWPVDTLPAGSAGGTDGHGGADTAMLGAFVDAVRSGNPSPLNLREGLRMSLPGVYAAASAAAGGSLTAIRYPWDGEETPPAQPGPTR